MRGQSSLYKSCYKPCHTESGCFLKSSTHALAAEQSCWESFGSSGKLAFQVLLQPCHRESGCFLKSSRQALATEQSCLDLVASSLSKSCCNPCPNLAAISCSLSTASSSSAPTFIFFAPAGCGCFWLLLGSSGYSMAGCSLPASCPKLLAKSFLPKVLCQKFLAATVSGRKRAQGESIPYVFADSGPRSKGRDASRLAAGLCWLVASGSLWRPPNHLECPWAGRRPFLLSSPLLSSPLLSSPLLSSPLLSSPLLSSPLLSSPLLSYPHPGWEPFRSGAKLTLQILLQTLPQRLLEEGGVSGLTQCHPNAIPAVPGSSPDNHQAPNQVPFPIAVWGRHCPVRLVLPGVETQTSCSLEGASEPLGNTSPRCFLKSSRQVLAAEQSCLENFLHAGPNSLYKSCHKPCHTESGCFLKSSTHALAAEQSCWETLGSSGKLTFLILLQALPQRAWLLLGEFQAGSGSRTELLGKLLHAGPSSLYKSCYKPCHTESGWFLKSWTELLGIFRI